MENPAKTSRRLLIRTAAAASIFAVAAAASAQVEKGGTDAPIVAAKIPASITGTVSGSKHTSRVTCNAWTRLSAEQTAYERFMLLNSPNTSGQPTTVAGSNTVKKTKDNDDVIEASTRKSLVLPKGRIGHASCVVNGNIYIHGGLHGMSEDDKQKILIELKSHKENQKKNGGDSVSDPQQTTAGASDHTEDKSRSCAHDGNHDHHHAAHDQAADSGTCGAPTGAAGSGSSAADASDEYSEASLTSSSSPQTILDDLWVYDYITNRWQEVEFDRSIPSSYPSGRLHHTLVPLRDSRHFLLIAGFNNYTTPDGHGSHNDVWKFDTVENTWTKLEFNKTETKRKYDLKRAVEAKLQSSERAAFNAEKEVRMRKLRAAKEAEIIAEKRRVYAERRAAREARNVKRAALRKKAEERKAAEKHAQDGAKAAAAEDEDECGENDPDCVEVEEEEGSSTNQAAAKKNISPNEVEADEPEEVPLPSSDEELLTEDDRKIIARVRDPVPNYRPPRGRTLFPTGRGSHECVLIPAKTSNNIKTNNNDSFDSDSILVFGGHSKIYAEPTRELWRFKLSDNSWEELTPRNESFPHSPSARVGFSFINMPSSGLAQTTDAKTNGISADDSDSIYLFGGTCATNSPTESNGQCADMWRLTVEPPTSASDVSGEPPLIASWAYIPSASNDANNNNAAVVGSPHQPRYAPAPRRAGHSQVVLDDALFMFGGVYLDNSDERKNHVFDDLWTFVNRRRDNADGDTEDETDVREWIPLFPNYGKQRSRRAPRPTFGHTIVALPCKDFVARAKAASLPVPAHCIVEEEETLHGGSILVFGGRHDSVKHHGSNEMWEFQVC